MWQSSISVLLLAGKKEQQQYSDLDLLFGVDFSNPSTLQRLRTSVLDCLKKFLPTHSDKSKFTECAMKEGYVHKLVRVHNPGADSWSLIALGNPSTGSKAIELKFVDKMRRQFEFTVDSFQIILDSLLTFYELASQPMTEHFYPTVVAEAVSGSFREAEHHLNHKLIATRNPEEIRGGGLLKYCKLLVERYHPAATVDIAALERYMCSRFFIDFPDIPSQLNKLESYMTNHFGEYDDIKVAYLQTLYDVVACSTVCLMNHERRETLHLIQCLLNKVYADMEMKQSVVQLDAFNSEDWVLDQVFYGTSYFPQAAYMAAGPELSPCILSAPAGGPVLAITSATPTPEEMYGSEMPLEFGPCVEEVPCSWACHLTSLE